MSSFTRRRLDWLEKRRFAGYPQFVLHLPEEARHKALMVLKKIERQGGLDRCERGLLEEFCAIAEANGVNQSLYVSFYWRTVEFGVLRPNRVQV
jgi:hypothetical protein